ncbi:MAG TPA: ADOP family duplicated permease [Candidatus Angelobacter sp.]|nr:ADOP family duplicated permease [Candidatus Angelobacter sp.]
MSIWSRIANTLRGDRVNREIDEELQLHLQEAIESGRDPDEARRAIGNALSLREQAREFRILPWFDSLKMDSIFGWRQVRKNKITSMAAVLSLALGMGACTAAFRLIDALLLRPLPISDPANLYGLSHLIAGGNGEIKVGETWTYPAFVQMRQAVKGKAELIAVSLDYLSEITYASDAEMEKTDVQYVSGWMFSSFGLHAAVGRLMTESDDTTPGANPVAVISNDYWTRRFGRDPKVVGRKFRMGTDLYQIIGVVDGPFSGTETGSMTALFVPTMMNPKVKRTSAWWHRTLVRLLPGSSREAVRQQLGATWRAIDAERMRAIPGLSREALDRRLNEPVLLEPAAAGASSLQRNYRSSLWMLAALTALVLLIACTNVANLVTAQAESRSREMAVRVSLGAGRSRLVRLVMLESLWIALLAAAAGLAFAWWAAPFVVNRIDPANNPVRLSLPFDFRLLGFAIALTLAVTLTFGAVPALRSSRIMPARVLKGGDDPKAQRRLMHLLVAGQVAFCFIVLQVAGLFVVTFQRLSNRPVGFSPEQVLVLDTGAVQPQLPAIWDQELEHLRSLPGLESAAISSDTLLSGWATNNFISVNGAPPNLVLTQMLDISPGWLHVMRIPLLSGRDFRLEDVNPGAAIVNQAFAREYFNGQDPVGRRFEVVMEHNQRLGFQIVGLCGDVAYLNVREPMPPQAYFPFRSLDSSGQLQAKRSGVILVRTSASDPMAMAGVLPREVRAGRAEFRLSDLQTQTEINLAHTLRERLLAMLSLFFATVALLLAGVGLYGVLNHSVLQRRREIGIRMAIGAQASNVARLVTSRMIAAVMAGAAAGLFVGLVCAQRLQALLFEVRATDAAMLMVPLAAIAAVAVLATIPAVLRAVHIDPLIMLRSE